MIKTINGIVTNVRLEITDTSCIIFNLDISIGSNNIIQFGNFNIGYPDTTIRYSGKDKEIVNYCPYYITRVFKVFGVMKMEQLYGKPVRVILNDDLCIGIQNFIDNTNYFVPPADFNDIDLSPIL